MKRILMTAMLASLVWCVAARADETADSQAIKDRLMQFSKDWSRHDANLLASYWVENGDLIAPDGTYVKGVAGLNRFFTEKFSTSFKHSTHMIDVKHIQFLTPDLALVDGICTLEGMITLQGQNLPPQTGRVVLVLTKLNGNWMYRDVRPEHLQALPAGSVQPLPTSTQKLPFK